MSSLWKLMAAAVGAAFVVSAQAQPVPFWSNKVPRPGAPGLYSFPCEVSPQGDMFFPRGSFKGVLNLSRIDRHGVATTKQFPVQPGGVQANFVCPTPDGGVAVSVACGEPIDGNLIWGNCQLMKFDSSLNLEWSVPTGETMSDLVDETREGRLYATQDGSIFLAQRLNGADAVVKYSPKGDILWTQLFDKTGFYEVYTFDLISDGAGGVWGSAYASPGGALVHYDGSSPSATPIAFANTGWLYHIARDPSGNLFFTCATPGAEAVGKTDPSGKLLWISSSYSGVGPYDLAADSQGFSYLLTFDNVNRRPVVTRFDPSGNLVYSKPYGNGFAYALLVDAASNAYVVAGPGYALTKILPNGDLGWPNLPNGTYVAPIDPDYKPYAFRGVRDAFGNFFLAGSLSDPANASTYYIGAAKLGLANNSAFVSQNVPSQMVAGQHYWVSLSFQNVGFNNWTAADNYFLKSQNPAGNSTWGLSRVDLGANDSISLDSLKSFGFYVTAPLTAGTRNFQWKIAQNGGAFGMPSANVAVNVIVRDHAAQYVSQSLPSTVSAGSSFTVKVTMKNVGTKTWTQTSGYALRPAPGYPTWGVTSVPLGGSDSIAPGGSKTFTVTCKAPTTPGTYAVRWQMHRSAPAFTGFFGDMTTNKSIVVTP